MSSKIILVLSILGCVSGVIAKVKFDEIKPRDDFDREILKRLKHIKPKRVASWSPQPVETKNCGPDDCERFCCSVTKEIKPYTLHLPTEGSNDYISERIVQSNFFEQRVKQTYCDNEGASCFKDFMPAILGYEAKCKTDMGSISLLVYNKEQNRTMWKNVPIAVSCSCHLVYKG